MLFSCEWTKSDADDSDDDKLPKIHTQKSKYANTHSEGTQAIDPIKKTLKSSTKTYI